MGILDAPGVRKGELVYSAGDSASLAAAITATPAGATVYLKGGTTFSLGSITSHNKDLTLVGDGPRSSVIDLGSTAFGFASGGTGTGARLTFRNIGFTGSTSAIFQLNRLFHYSVRFIDCRFSGFAASGIQTFGTNLLLVRCEFSTAGTPGTSDAIVCNRGAQSIHIEDCTFKYLRRGIYATTTNGPVTNLVVTGCTFDGGWMYLKSTASNSGGTVTYSATTVTDTAASFPAFTANDTIRALAAKRTGTITTISNNEITDSAADFTSAGVLVGDIFRTSTAWGVVQEVVSTTVLRIEEWIDSTTYEPTPPKTTTTAYTVYGLVIGRVVSNTSTVVTVDGWRDWTGTGGTPSSGTLYERAPKGDYQGVFCASGKKVRITNNSIRRSWADQVSVQADQELIVSGNNIYDGQDVGITVGMPSTTLLTNNYIISDNTITHQGTAGVWLGANYDGKVHDNVVVNPNWMSLSGATYGGIMVQYANRTDISNNTIRREAGYSPSAPAAIHLYYDGSNTTIANIAINDNQTSGYSAAGDIKVTNSTAGGVTNVTGRFQADTVFATSGSQALGILGTFTGTGTPEFVIPAAIGSQYRRTDGDVNTALYLKTSGTGTTGWLPQPSQSTSNSVVISGGSLSATTTQVAMTAARGCTLDQASLTVRSNVTASDTDYWTIALWRYRAGVGTSLVSKTTKTTGGQAFTAFVDWNYDAATWADTKFFKGDVLVLVATPTGAPGTLDGLTMTTRCSLLGSVITLASDTFGRADSASSLGTADVGGAWANFAGAGIWGIRSGTAYVPGTPGTLEKAYIDTGVADVTVTAKIAALAASGSVGVMGRAVSTGSGSTFKASGFLTSGNALFYNDGTTQTTLGTIWTPVLAAGDTVRLIMSGTTVSVWVDYGTTGTFVQKVSVTNSNNLTETKHGIRSSSNTGGANALDNFTVTTP